MQAILVQQGLVEALKGETRMSPTLSQKEKKLYKVFAGPIHMISNHMISNHIDHIDGWYLR